MKSKKDEGNDYFKKQKYEQAIKCYNDYVKVAHPDNSKAYSNMALSYFRLKKYQDCVKACEAAVQTQPQFQKAFYRMYEAYKELKDYYGMLISAEKFCKLSKEQKDIKTIQKDIAKVKEALSFNTQNDPKPQQIDKLIMQIVNLERQSNKNQKAKEPQICLDAKWQKIEHLVQQNRRVGLNEARKFLNQHCKTQEDKDKYKKKIRSLNNIKQNGILTAVGNNLEKSQSSEEEAKVQQIQKYTASLEKQSKKTPNQQKIIETPKETESQSVNKQQDKQKPTQSEAKKQIDPSGKWEDFVNKEEAQRLFEIHISQKLKKSQDQFTGFYQLLINLISSSELDRFEKEAVLSVTPEKLKKFNMLMKSYTGKQKQQLAQTFSQHNLDKVMKLYNLTK